MPDDLTVHLNRRQRHGIEPAQPSLAVAEGFEVILRNHGESSHVNVSLGGDLGGAGLVETPNPFVPADEELRVPVAITTDRRPLEGTILLASGYGQTETEIPVSVVSPHTVETEPTSKQTAKRRSPSTDVAQTLEQISRTIDDPATVALLAVITIALVFALVAAWQIGGLVVFAAAAVVIAAVCVALVTVLRS